MSSSYYNADAYVTAANPAPGRQVEFSYPIRSGTGWTTGSGIRVDGGIGLNVYLAGGSGASGSVPVYVLNPSSGSSGSSAQPASTGTPATFSFQTSSTDLLLAANPSRITFKIYNDSNGTYLVNLGAGASSGVFDFSLFPQHYYEDPYPGYTGIVTGIGFGSGSGTIHVKEMKP